MSRWTHLAGFIRIDRVPRVNAGTAEDIIRALLEGAPEGSEGGCNFHFYEWPTVEGVAPEQKNHTNLYEGGIYWGDAIVSADLRDFGDAADVEKVKEWFTGINRKLWEMNLMTRQAVLEIEVEYTSWCVLNLQDFLKNKWIETKLPGEVLI